MSGNKDGRKDQSRKRKLLTSGVTPSANQSENIISTENPPTAEENAVSQEAFTIRSVADCPQAKYKRRYEKYLSTVITQSNHQHDLETQRGLAMLQAQNEDSDDELQPRRIRSNDCPTTIRNVPRTESAARNVYSDLELMQHSKGCYHGLGYANSMGNVDLPHRNSIRNQSGENNDDNHQNIPLASAVSGTNLSDDDRTILQRYQSRRMRDNGSTALGTFTTPSRDMSYISRPGTSTGTVNALNSINFPDFEDYEPFQRPRNEINVTAVPGTRSSIAPTATESQSENGQVICNTNCQSNNAYCQVGLVPEGEESDVSDEIVSIFGDDYGNNPSQSVDRFRISADLESNDDEFLQMVEDVNNCSISVSSQRGCSRPSLSLDSQNQGINPGRGQHRQGGHDLRQHGPQPQQSTHFSVPYQLPAEDAFAAKTNSYYVLGNDHVFYPVVVTEKGYGDLRTESINRAVPPRRHGRNDNPRNEPLTHFSPREPFPLHFGRRRTGGWSRACRITGSSMQNEQSNSQNSPNRGAPEEQATTSSQAGALSDTRSSPFGNEIGICPICKKGLLKTKVVSTFCGHLFCSDCIKNIITTNGKRCPKCNQPLEGQCYHPVYF